MTIPVNPTDVAKAAKAYLAHGWSVIPIRPQDKRPLVKWEDYQTRKPTAAEWTEWAKTPGINIALVTGEVSGVTVVDVDGADGMASMQPVNDRLPKTMLAKSPHGWHLFFRYEPGLRNKARLMPGIDIRGDGGYVLIAPSELPDAAYKWVRVIEPVAFPKWLANGEKPEPADKQQDDQPRWVASALKTGVPGGQRNAMATRLAGYFFARNIPEDVVRATLEPYRKACRPELAADELAEVIRSVGRYRKFAAAAGVTDPPTVQRTVAGERYLWDDVAVTVRSVSRSRTALLAELGVTLSLPGMPETVKAPAVMNLVSQRERDGLAQSLRRQVPEIDWDTRIDVLCRLVLESYRRGDPATLLRDARRPGNGDFYAIKPLLLADAPTVWFADGGTGKSLLALAAASAMSGHNVFGGMRPTRPRRVLYLDWEWEDWQHAERLSQLLGEDADASDLLYRRCYGALSDEVDAIRQIVADEEVEYVVVDSLGAACGGDLTDADTALRFGANIRALDVGSLWITHVTKNGGPDPDKPFGTVYFHNMARMVWRIKRQADNDSDQMDVGFYCTKSNAGRIPKPVGLRVAFGGGAIQVTTTDLLANPDLASGLTLKTRIVGELRRGPQHPGELADVLGTTHNTVKSKLTLMRRDGAVEPVGDGTWALAAKSEPHPRTAQVELPSGGSNGEVPDWLSDMPSIG